MSLTNEFKNGPRRRPKDDFIRCERNQQGRQAVSLGGYQEEGDEKAEEKAKPFALEVASGCVAGVEGFRERERWGEQKPRVLVRAGLGLSQRPKEKGGLLSRGRIRAAGSVVLLSEAV